MSEEGKYIRRKIWQHNGYFGHAAMAIRAMQAMQRAKTTTDETQLLAFQIEGQLQALIESLRTRAPEFEEERKALSDG